MPKAVRAVEWIPRFVKIPASKETAGPFSLAMVPYVRRVLEVIDEPCGSPLGRTIILRWAARNAKTTTVCAIMIYRTTTRHLPGMAMSCDEQRTDDLFESDLEPMAEACSETRGLLLPKRQRRRERGLQLGADRIRRAFGGSPSTLAGYPAATIAINEAGKTGAIGKGVKNQTRQEAHPIPLAKQRGKLFGRDLIFMVEGTPTKAGQCPLSALADAPSTQRLHFFVHCPHCRAAQRLQWSEKYGPYKNAGVKWEKGADGHTDALIAERTAYYECRNGCRIDNSERPAMIRGGQWVAEGQLIDADGVITGEPLVDSSDICFDELSTLYSLLVSGWGQLAGEWARALGDPERVRDFVNSTLARQWDEKPETVDPHVVATRICVEKVPPLTIPSWAVFLTAGVDAQAEATLFPFVFSAWGPGGRGHKVAHGMAEGFDALKSTLQRAFVFNASQDKTRALLTLIDSGNERDRIYDFCAECLACGLDVRPTKGSSTDIKQLDYQESEIEDRPGIKLVMVNTYTTNPWLQRILNGVILPSDPLFYSLTEADQLDLALIGQLCNGQLLERRTDMGRTSRAWDKIHESVPDDLRDAVRYSRVAAQVLTQHGTTWNALPSTRILIAEPAPPPAVAHVSQDNSDRGGFSPRRDLRRR